MIPIYLLLSCHLAVPFVYHITRGNTQVVVGQIIYGELCIEGQRSIWLRVLPSAVEEDTGGGYRSEWNFWIFIFERVPAVGEECVIGMNFWITGELDEAAQFLAELEFITCRRWLPQKALSVAQKLAYGERCIKVSGSDGRTPSWRP